MKLFQGKQEDYRKNLACMEEVTDRLLGHMKGHGFSFRQEITDSKGDFSQEKLCGLVEELVERWVETLRESTDKDPSTGESLAEPYIRERRELYGLYLYLVMRCSLCQGAYAKAYPYGSVEKERTDFAFLLEQARRLTRRWCVMAEPDGGKRNELYEGYDEHFGFHLYKTLVDPQRITDDSALSPWWKRQNNLKRLTNEGNMKRIYIRHHSRAFQGSRGKEIAPGKETAPDEETAPDKAAAPANATVRAEETAQLKACRDEAETDSTDSNSSYEDGSDGGDGYEDDDAYEDFDDYDDYDAYGDYDAYEDDNDPYPFPDFETKAEFEAAAMEQWAQEYERADYLASLALSFACKAEYLEACRRFTASFEKARPDVLRDFYQELERIVGLYLAERNLSPLADTDKTLDVYSRVSDGPCRQAGNYERRLQWENL
ncbi:hypothetical protein [uncultured Acetatifactor sp.]|uniref:hypothetical protein n=1 Tax=uncultured Acetatifactor sp. TaxID=1671927 RepID=UPI002636F238|nr:hypothetical protein [uncultured Acetatifactor sp.]